MIMVQILKLPSKFATFHLNEISKTKMSSLTAYTFYVYNAYLSHVLLIYVKSEINIIIDAK